MISNTHYDWEKCWLFFSKPSVDGKTIRGPAMRRRSPDGPWQYRAMTETEDYEDQIDTAV